MDASMLKRKACCLKTIRRWQEVRDCLEPLRHCVQWKECGRKWLENKNQGPRKRLNAQAIAKYETEYHESHSKREESKECKQEEKCRKSNVEHIKTKREAAENEGTHEENEGLHTAREEVRNHIFGEFQGRNKHIAKIFRPDVPQTFYRNGIRNDPNNLPEHHPKQHVPRRFWITARKIHGNKAEQDDVEDRKEKYIHQDLERMDGYIILLQQDSPNSPYVHTSFRAICKKTSSSVGFRTSISIIELPT